MSLILREDGGAGAALALLPLLAAVAVCDVVGEEALIKWPNDVVLRGGGDARLAKLAGILAEGRPAEGWAVLGIGLNVAVEIERLPKDVRGRAASMGADASEVEPTLARLLGALGERLAEPVAATLDAWRARDALRGEQITWSGTSAQAPRSGTAMGVDGDGRLIVELAGGGRTTLSAGEVHLAPGP
jgi:BirA family biotin operon repressor/biotin-[acetyl-CoA-carboxylase] ligase